MIYGSVCSGIEAATVAWHSLGWTPAFFSEIEPFPSAVLAHHYPEVPNLGDFTRINWDFSTSVDLLVGGTPCQAFSVAGKRAGLDDPRGNLTLEFVRLADRLRSRWLVWENVPGVLSIDGGRTFGTFLAALAQVGYGFAYRVLDAQYFGVPQRRRRVFLVGYLGDWRRAAAVLFERESLCGNPPPSREKREETARGFTPSSHGSYREGFRTLRADGGDLGGGSETLMCWPDLAMHGMARDYKGPRNYQDGGLQNSVVLQQNASGDLRVGNVVGSIGTNSNASGRNTGMIVSFNWQENRNFVADENTANPLRRNQTEAVATVLRMREGCSGGGKGPLLSENQSLTLAANTNDQVLFSEPIYGIDSEHNGRVELMGPLQARSGTNVLRPSDMDGLIVRRLTPVECERLQGFPDGYTDIPVVTRGKRKRLKSASDSARYKALGNSMAVPCMRWIGERIQAVEDLCQHIQ